jgi:hypothetical protein
MMTFRKRKEFSSQPEREGDGKFEGGKEFSSSSRKFNQNSTPTLVSEKLHCCGGEVSKVFDFD